MKTIILSGISAVSLTALAAYLLNRQKTPWGRVLPLGLLLLAGLEVCDSFSLELAPDAAALRQMSQIIESLLPAAFLAIGLTHARNTTISSVFSFRAAPAFLLALFPPALLALAGKDLSYFPDLQNERLLFLGSAGYWFYLGIMTACIISLVHIEATFSATRGSERYRITFAAVGIMSMLAVMIFYYSQGLLYRTINMNLMPVRSGVFTVAALLVGYSRAVRGNGVRVVVSRHVFYRSVALLAVGIYLLGLGIVGEGMKYFGDAFGRNIALFLSFAGGILLLVLLLSMKVRRFVKVLVSKHFFAQKYDYREEWLKFTERLVSCSTLPATYAAIVAAFRETFGLEAAALYVLHRDGNRFVRAESQGMPEGFREVRISERLKSYLTGRNRVWNPDDGEYVPTADEGTFIASLEAHMIIPLPGKSGIEGLVIFGKQVVSAEYTYEDYDFMKSLARQAAPVLASSRLSEELTEHREMAAVARVSSFVVHDLKNLTGGLSLLVENAEEHRENREFQRDAMETMRNTVLRMEQLIQRLKSASRSTAAQVRVENIDRLSRDVVAEFSGRRTSARLLYEGVPAFSNVDGDEIKKVVINLVHNAIEASGGQGTVAVETGRENGHVRIRVSDTGCGMTEEFLTSHVFKPFRTTKKKGLGIGLYQSRQIVESHGGRIDVASTEGKGSVFTVYLPSAPGSDTAVPAEAGWTGRRQASGPRAVRQKALNLAGSSSRANAPIIAVRQSLSAIGAEE